MNRRWILLLCLAAACAATALTAVADDESFAVTRGEHCPFKISTTHFEVEFSVPPALGKGYAGLCEKAYTKFSKIFQVDPSETVWEGKCHVFLFKDHEEFVQFASTVHQSDTGAMSGGYTRITKKDPDIVLFLRGRDHVLLQQTLIHEMTHVFLQLFHKEAYIPLWVHEGFAQYFEFQHFTPKSRFKEARRIIKVMVKAGQQAPLTQFWVSSFPPTDIASYSEAYSLIDFIAGSKELRQKTGKFVLSLKDTSSPADKPTSAEGMGKALANPQADLLKTQENALKEIFGLTLPQFETMWKRYVLTQY